MSNIFCKYVRFKGHKIKTMSLKDSLEVVSPIKVIKRKGLFSKTTITRESTHKEQYSKLRLYISNNSKPVLNIDNIEVQYVTQLMEKICIADKQNIDEKKKPNKK